MGNNLITHRNSVSSSCVMNTFISSSLALNFLTHEGLQYYLDLGLLPSGLCWAFQQLSKKPVRPFCSSHSTMVKHGIIRSLFISFRAKSCDHQVAFGISTRQKHLLKARYPSNLPTSILIRPILDSGSTCPPRKKASRVVTTTYVPLSPAKIK